MTVAAAMERIENPETQLITGIASSIKVFRRLLSTLEATRVLLDAARNSTHVQSAIYERITILLRHEPMAHYENPADTPLAAYLSILVETSPAIAAQAAANIRAGKNLHWSRHLANATLDSNSMLESKGYRANTTNVRFSRIEPGLLMSPEQPRGDTRGLIITTSSDNHRELVA